MEEVGVDEESVEVQEWIKAVVQDVQEGRHGPFAIATAEGIDGSITFSLEQPVWEEHDHPEPGHCVFLTDIRRKEAGWRAHRAKYLRPGHLRKVN